jgi:hypothetical protein
MKKNGKNGVKKDLVIKDSTPPATIEATGRGFEEPTAKEDLILPRAVLLQALSPQVVEGTEGCKAGKIINNITNEVMPETFIPVFKYTEFLKFNPRDSKADNYDPAYDAGALIWRTNDANDPRTVECRFGEDGSKPTAIKVLNFLCYFPGMTMPVVLGFSKTSYKAGKKLISLAQFSGGDMFSRTYKLVTKPAESNGNKYFVLDVGFVGKTNQENFKIAEAMYINFRGKDLKVHEEGIVEEEQVTE